jgi:hypothetical protein
MVPSERRRGRGSIRPTSKKRLKVVVVLVVRLRLLFTRWAHDAQGEVSSKAAAEGSQVTAEASAKRDSLALTGEQCP